MTGEECVVRGGKERIRKLPDLPGGKCPVTFPEPIFPLCLRAFIFANLCGEGPLGAIPARSRQDSVSGILSRAGSRGGNVMAHQHGTHSVDRLRPGGEEGPQGLEAASQPFCPHHLPDRRCGSSSMKQCSGGMSTGLDQPPWKPDEEKCLLSDRQERVPRKDPG